MNDSGGIRFVKVLWLCRALTGTALSRVHELWWTFGFSVAYFVARPEATVGLFHNMTASAYGEG